MDFFDVDQIVPGKNGVIGDSAASLVVMEHKRSTEGLRVQQLKMEGLAKVQIYRAKSVMQIVSVC